MTDTVLKGTGNSRTMRTVSNARTLYPDWSSALTAMINGTFPIDIGNLQSSGVSTSGTPYNKANVLPNATCTALGIATTSVPKDAFDKLAEKIQEIETKLEVPSVGGGVGSYTGNGGVGPNASNTLTFARKPLFVCVAPDDYLGAFCAVRGQALIFHYVEGDQAKQVASWGSKSLSWYNDVNISINSAKKQLNASGKIYYYFAILEP